MNYSQRLHGKTAVITGAADGIGLAISRAFAREGAMVVMGDINEEKCRLEAAAIVASGGQAITQGCDVSDTEAVNALITLAISKFGRIDILVNNAAIGLGGNIMEMTEEEWDHLMNINLKSVFRGIRAALPHMIEQGTGSVINIASVQASRSFHNWTAYAGAKGAILAMTNQLAGQFGENNVRFNAISPGAILTPMNLRRAEEEGPDFLTKSADLHAFRRLGTPEEVAQAAIFLASDESSFVTGQNLRVDGGLCTLPRYEE